MIVTCVHIYVKEECIDDFIKATWDNHNGSIKESGNLRFDFIQSSDDPTRFMLYEVFASKEAEAAHIETEHYHKWRETVGPFMAKDREQFKYQALAPKEEDQWKY